MAIPWWESDTIYQIYPRSFQDGDGDLAGNEARRDYLVALGIDAVWLSPILRSPMADFGYDVADRRDITGQYYLHAWVITTALWYKGAGR